ncbi:MAG: LysM peptidoglycan-binding domain-containing protein [Ginsengibacter sp.]
MRKFLMVIALISIVCKANSQGKLLIVEGTSPQLYLVHKVEPKENFYSIGRLYNISPKEIAPFNNLLFEKGLAVGQTIKIPLTETNFLQYASSNTGGMVPVYHIIQAKEGLYRVSTVHKVPIDVLKKWNNLNSDVVSNGTKLIVGYLKVQKDQPDATAQVTPPQKVPPVDNAITLPVEKKKEKIKIEEKKEPVVIKETMKIPEPVKTEPEMKEKETKAVGQAIDFKGGSFKNLYNEQVNHKKAENEAGTAAVFKTTSGWQDGKYYCFHNTASPGTIIKVTNGANGKTVYAKVLDAIPDIKQNSGLMLRISNAAAEELGAGENKFDCSITYFK